MLLPLQQKTWLCYLHRWNQVITQEGKSEKTPPTKRRRRRNAAPARRWVALTFPSLCLVVFSVSLFFWVVVLAPRSLWHVAIRAAYLDLVSELKQKNLDEQVRRLKGEVRTLVSSFFFASIAARFLYWQFFFFLSRLGEVHLGGLVFFDFSIFLMFLKCFFFSEFFVLAKKTGKKKRNASIDKNKGKWKETQASVMSVTVGRDTDQPTNQSFRVCKVNLATLKVAIHKVFPYGGGNTPLQWRREESTTTQRRREAAAPHQIKPAQIIPPHRTTTPHHTTHQFLFVESYFVIFPFEFTNYHFNCNSIYPSFSL